MRKNISEFPFVRLWYLNYFKFITLCRCFYSFLTICMYLVYYRCAVAALVAPYQKQFYNNNTQIAVDICIPSKLSQQSPLSVTKSEMVLSTTTSSRCNFAMGGKAQACSNQQHMATIVHNNSSCSFFCSFPKTCTQQSILRHLMGRQRAHFCNHAGVKV